MKLLPQSPADILKAGTVVVLLFGLLMLEAKWPRRPRESGRVQRWRNVGLIAVSTLALRVVAPAGAAAFAALWSWGALHQIDWPTGIEFALSLVLLDLAIYWQHRIFHGVPWLWRGHRVHHSDTEFDASLGVRFQPFDQATQRVQQGNFRAGRGGSVGSRHGTTGSSGGGFGSPEPSSLPARLAA